ncbi:MAG: hypothetical protein ABIL16_00360 [candidate division WOR-3 bacterium]
MIGFLLFVSSPDVNVAKDTVVETNMSFWSYSSCAAASGVEVLAFYLSSGLSGGIPLLISTGAGGTACAVYSYTAYTLTPIKELKPKAFNSAFRGGTVGIFLGLGTVIVLKRLGVF